ncbi:MAG TPA: metallophosphoesterase family protein [Actinomycetota bacterium]|jgi:hypothetical protein|nr:metallophosphoesterase family protein [Actinomycetota bacterium]
MGHGHPERPYVSRREFLKRTAYVGAAAAAGPWFWRQLAYADDAPARQLHLNFGADASRDAVISFMTDASVKHPFAELGGRRWTAETAQYPGYPGYFHHVHVHGLNPAKAYAYRVGHSNKLLSPRHVHRTGPSGRARFTFTAFGDQGVDGPQAGLPPVSQPPVQASANVELANSFKPAMHLIVGDLAYANGDQAIWDKWFDMIEPMAANIPWMPCIGNHEIETQVESIAGAPSDSWGTWGYDPYRTRFALPENGSSKFENCFYTFRYGSVQFVSVDNNDINEEIAPNKGYTGGGQRRWFEKQLAAAHASPDVDFIVVLMHQCAFSSSSKHGSDPGVFGTWAPLFAKYSVDLVFQGHDHVYERTHAMRRSDIMSAQAPYKTDVGTVYVTCGNGGAVQEPFMPLQPAWSAFRQDFKIGTVRVDVDPAAPNGMQRLTLGEYWALDGSAIEEGIVLEKPRKRTDTKVASAGADADADSEQRLAASAPEPGMAMPVTGGRGAATLIGTATAAGAAGARLYANRERRTKSPRNS